MGGAPVEPSTSRDFQPAHGIETYVQAARRMRSPVGRGPGVLETLSRLHDGVGDDRIAEALFRQRSFERR